ncbi:MAG: peptidoglycan DD-metalloendopeptidase family protein [Burkholderiales bacterium]|nr:peptidoglycan DD-metalloendopeptidase family protein [Burkholderiales bacterium]
MNKNRMVIKWKRLSAWLVAAAVVAGCSTTSNRAPVEDRGAAGRAPVAAGTMPGVAAAAPADASRPLPGAENSGKPGYYTVKPGDTLIRIGLENGQNWKDLVKWNGLDNPNIIEVGQVLRVVQPGLDANAASTKPISTARIESRPLEAKGVAPAASGSVVAAPAAAPATAVAPATATAREGDDDLVWSWPAAGPVLAPFDDGKSKGLSIGGKAGDPVYAAADGRVVYAGSGLRGYGNLIILKHNNTYLTAYAHNQTLLVKEDQTVKRGQKIAEMGSTDADSVKLHFEIRKQGKPIDPAKLLPPR